MAGTLRITLRKGLAGIRRRHRETVRGLGLRRINHTVEREDTPQIRGMVRSVAHMVEVEEKS